mgnify:CR=1 FL=1
MEPKQYYIGIDVGGTSVKEGLFDEDGNLLAKAIVTNRFQPMNANGKTVHMIGLPWHFGWLVPKRGGDSANLLTAAVGDPNSAIPESKAFMVNIEKMPDQDLPE